MTKNCFRLFISVFLLFIGNSVVSAQEYGAFYPGEIWKDNNGVHINAHGGGILYHEGKYYWFGEHKSERTSAALVGVTCYSSADLYNWTNEGIALAVSDDNSSDIAKG
ncbi:MAG: beta-glucanase, partial [Dysgonamonadaceae bacterium]|nr:beta-glucanase [Dysgonamonadaceae bacterium]